ncbi:MAG: hypothetical protein ACRC80_08815, partial [Waterburya sp.]
ILLSMIKYNCSYIREAIASNKNASKKVIKQLLITNKEKESEEKIYSLILANNINPPQKLVDKAINNQDLLRSLISNKDLDLKILDNISNLTKDKIELTSWRLASNSNTSVATLVKLSETADFYTRDYVRYLVATNPQTPVELSIEILEHFLNKEDGVNFRLIEAYLEVNPSGISSTVERYLKHSSSNIVRLILLFNPYISKIDFKKHSESLDWLERYAIAQNPNTPLDIIQKLTNDANKVVRAAAKDNLKNQQILENKQKANI